MRSIQVEDANGDQLIVYEFENRRFFFWKSHRFELDTGESVQPVDDDTLIVVSTGELLSRMS